MTIQSENDIIAALGNGRRRSVFGSKLISPAHTAGGWHLLAGISGDPVATTFPGTDLMFKSCSEQAGDGTNLFGIQHGGDVSPNIKHAIITAASIVAAAGAPWFAQLVDVQGYYRLSTTNVTGTGSRVLLNGETFTANAGTDIITYALDWNTFTKVRFTTTGTLPAGLSLNTDYWLVRQSATTAKVASSFANALAGTTIDITDTGTGTHTLTARVPRADGGIGVEASLVVQTAPTAGGPNMTASSYTNAAGTAGRAFQNNPTMGAAADAYAGRILHSGNAAGRYGPFLSKQSGDTGIRSIESFTLSGGTAYTGTGVLAMVLAKPLGRPVPIASTGMYTERELKNQIPSLPIIEPGACLAWMLMSTGATTNLSPLTFDADFIWG